MGARSSKYNSIISSDDKEPIFQIVDDFLKERVEDVAKRKLKPGSKYSIPSIVESESQTKSDDAPRLRTLVNAVAKQSSGLIEANTPKLPTTVNTVKSVRALALRYHSRQRNSYIPQEVLASFLSNKKGSMIRQNSRDTNKSISGASSVSHASLVDGAIEVKANVAVTPVKSAGKGLLKKPMLKLQIHDDEDWIQVRTKLALHCAQSS